jgi:HTH-type transcriptional regulator/antitoxin HigA
MPQQAAPQADTLDVLTLLVADYEVKHFPIEDPDPVQFLEYVMESRGLTRKDLEPYLGSRARVAEILNRTDLNVPRLRRVQIGVAIQAADELMRQAGTLLGGRRRR